MFCSLRWLEWWGGHVTTDKINEMTCWGDANRNANKPVFPFRLSRGSCLIYSMVLLRLYSSKIDSPIEFYSATAAVSNHLQPQVIEVNRDGVRWRFNLIIGPAPFPRHYGILDALCYGETEILVGLTLTNKKLSMSVGWNVCRGKGMLLSLSGSCHGEGDETENSSNSQHDVILARTLDGTNLINSYPQILPYLFSPLF